MARKDPSALRDEAAQAVERGKLPRALELYAELEAGDPTSPTWPKRIGEVARKAGNPAAAIVAFDRAVDKFVKAGFLVQAIAVCKLILQIDPAHSATVGKLAELGGAPPPMKPIPPPPRALPPRTLVVAPPPPKGVAPTTPAGPRPGIALSQGGALDSLDLGAVV
ncbi:MAG: hypothetical protein NT062_04105, partial [Proteobacteria bacterium]|nr:hypothetical protein [Pseudomonadota bacterium]